MGTHDQVDSIVIEFIFILKNDIKVYLKKINKYIKIQLF